MDIPLPPAITGPREWESETGYPLDYCFGLGY